ncbi:WecB/TagA/CpsF family glycosyltransferase [Paracoccus solventivorans]|nr:WecB/TagA/CpsF family glycosyltransferase [Paracoccus solventivorans]
MVERKHSGACRNWRKVPLLNVFVHDVTMDPAEIDGIIAKINDSGATVLLVGLGGGRQEKNSYVRYRDRMPNIHLFLPLGGTIDYEAGTFKRPPAWITEWGFEWLYRLLKEPRQRWHRYIVHEPPVL